MYPVFFDIEGKHCLVVGGGRVAERKIKGLLEEGALVTVISSKISENIKKLKKSRKFSKKMTILSKNYTKNTIKDSKDSFFMIFSATNSKKTNELVSKEAVELGIPVNVADVPALCSFYLPARVKRGSFEMAISTGGKIPYFAKSLKEMFDSDIPTEFGSFVDILGAVRFKLLKKNGKNGKKYKINSKTFDNLINSPLLEWVIEAGRSGSQTNAKRKINSLLKSEFGEGFTLSALGIKL